MTEMDSFAKVQASLSRAASAGTIAAAEELAAALRRDGMAAIVEPRLDGTASVALEGAGTVARNSAREQSRHGLRSAPPCMRTGRACSMPWRARFAKRFRGGAHEQSGMALQKAIFTALTNNAGLATLIGNPPRVYDDPPGMAELPYIQIGEGTESDWSTSTQSGAEHLLTIHVWSRTGDACRHA